MLKYTGKDHEADDLSRSSSEHSESEVSTASSTKNGKSKRAGSKQFARRETEQICCLRGVVAILIILACFFVSAFIFYSTRKSEIDQYEVQFKDHATTILDSFDTKLKEGVVSMDNLAVTLTALSISNDIRWPFASVPQWTVRAKSTLQTSSAELLAIIPLVQERQRGAWESYSLQFQGWIEETASTSNNKTGLPQGTADDVDFSEGIADQIYSLSEGNPVVEQSSGPFYPVWQHEPVDPRLVNFNIITDSNFRKELEAAAQTESLLVGQVSEPGRAQLNEGSSAIQRIAAGTENPLSNLYFPIFSQFGKPRDLEAFVMLNIDWAKYLEGGTLPESANGIICILANDCGQSFSYKVDNGSFIFIGEGDRHDETYDDMVESIAVQEGILTEEFLASLSYAEFSLHTEFCPYSLYVYPSAATENQAYTNRPTVYTILVVVVFLFTSFAFVAYDYLVEQRQKVVLSKALKSHQIIAGLFPAVVRNRLFGDGDEDGSQGEQSTLDGSSAARHQTGKMRINSYLNSGEDNEATKNLEARKGIISRGKPIADLFPNATVLFADIAGFTAWSSAREPAQVFILLETLYAAFDKMATKRKVFKVETIGDCYVAVTGLPVPQDNHAIIMARFAGEMLRKMDHLSQTLGSELGPDTADLSIRVGLHSGPVTAGVLRGERSRFQLFGDTVNTASRMESNGRAKFIQCSQATADLLTLAGKAHWLTPRQDRVHAKGLGAVATFWVSSRSGAKGTATDSSIMSDSESVASSFGGEDDNEDSQGSPQVSSDILHRGSSARLIEWMKDLMIHQIKVIVAQRMSLANDTFEPQRPESAPNSVVELGGRHPRDEYRKVIALPKFDAKVARKTLEPGEVTLEPEVVKQLHDYISRIASSYHKNPFHNFEHAAHVSMSVNKILSRIVAAEDYQAQEQKAEDQIFAEIHEFTYGITSDPLTHFACLFSAMIHDVDHAGVSNSQLCKEQNELALMYDNKSVLEQNSIDLSWEMLMEPAYKELRSCLFATDGELARFRELLVNSVMATDIFDPELKSLRDERWNEAFHCKHEGRQGSTTNLKATIVIEHIIQASDVAHTMQHWHVYQKWNKRLFEELYLAYKDGRANGDPSVNWYKGEVWFFDNYVIPLAKKLKECGVFGVASDEFLQYALNNRSEWEKKGEAIVKDMVEELAVKVVE